MTRASNALKHVSSTTTDALAHVRDMADASSDNGGMQQQHDSTQANAAAHS